MTTKTVQDVLGKIIHQLQNHPEITPRQMLELNAKYSVGSKVKTFNPKNVTSWDALLFRGNRTKRFVNPENSFLRIEDAMKCLGLIPNDWRLGRKDWLTYLNEISVRIGSPEPPKDPLTEALAALFGMSSKHYSVSDIEGGEYYGYRRSSNSGRLVRFHIKIVATDGKTLPSFENTYRQGRAHWVVRGHAIKVDGSIYLLGQAKSATQVDKGLGLRFFVLNDLKMYGWNAGLLSSIDASEKPIASRIVLIPADQHRFKGKPVVNVMNFIKGTELSPGDLGDQIVGNANIRYEEDDIPTFVQSLIWNGSLRTLHCGARRLPRPEEADIYARVFAFQKLAIARHPAAIDDISFFTKFLQDEAVWEATEAYLKRQ